MQFDHLATELVTHVFLSCNSVSDVLALSSTCHRFRQIYNSSQKLVILEHAAEANYGPLEDLTQLLTHNASQPAHLLRAVPFSTALLKQITHTGRVAEKWCDIYPFKKWKQNFEHRRLLTTEERYRLRRALYRLWLYTRAFHNRQHPRETRAAKLVIQKRAELLHNWSTLELAEIADVHAVLREVLHSNVCPSNGTIARKFKKRFPDNEHHSFNIHLNYPPTPPPCPAPSLFNSQYHSTPNVLSNHFHTTSAFNSRYSLTKYSATSYHESGAEGWGDDIPHYYVVEDMLKLDPEQIMWLKENAPFKGHVEMFVRGIGDWFENNGETWVQTLEWVLTERGEDVVEVLGGVADGELGIAVWDE
ncbi:hypothetical protein K432DRAFT_415071 [Lepidopterella palustris CBS 459.81]|uniref:F-box domain-containing protein n=1 Tax=Lepidopterella palustris CBS 459.81 TaxID=1314670 RepID=A0A8E2EF11_9PEZI|nr:hypothetical protein K432DRAFT_415071 [Lepidopterella palustris CBS 459.81]